MGLNNPKGNQILMNRKSCLRYLGLLLLPAVVNGCYVFSAFQSAKTLEKGEISITPSLSNIAYNTDSTWSFGSTNLGVQAAYGLSKKINIAGRYELLNTGYNIYQYLDASMKVGLIPDMLSLSLPVGVYIGESLSDARIIYVQPTLLTTYSVNKVWDLNASVRDIVIFDGDFENMVAGNVGVGISGGSNGFLLTFLPEIGVLVAPRENDYFINFGIGFGMKW